jgi:hypothetical protein
MCVEYRMASFRDDIPDSGPGCNFLEFSILLYHYKVLFKGKTDIKKKNAAWESTATEERETGKFGIMCNKERGRILMVLSMVYNTITGILYSGHPGEGRSPKRQ